MSTLHSTENRKQPPSIYTVMLLLSMLFLTDRCDRDVD